MADDAERQQACQQAKALAAAGHAQEIERGPRDPPFVPYVEPVMVREITQTDHINAKLLGSFAKRAAELAAADESTDDDDDEDSSEDDS